MLELAKGVLAEPDLDVVLERVVEAARVLAGARYATLGIRGESGTEPERFFTTGIDEKTRRGIGEPPRGALRVPLLVRGQEVGALYLTDDAGGAEFTQQDQENVERLAELAGAAIERTRRHGGSRSHDGELEQTVEALEATIQIVRALGGETDLHAILDLVAKRGRVLVAARGLLIEYEQSGEMMVAAAAGELPVGLVGRRVGLPGSVAADALQTGKTLRLEDEANMTRFERHGAGQLGIRASAGLVVPMLFRGQGHGVLIAIDRLEDGPAFTAEDQRLLEAFAASAATAVATAESLEAERRRQRLAAAEQERSRWARELHDETLQSLAALRLGLAAQLRGTPAPEAVLEAIRESVAQLDADIATLRALITDLRPAALDDLGAEAAIEDLANRAHSRGVEVDVDVNLDPEDAARLAGELETAIYRTIQEALTNAHKHGQARRASVEVHEDERMIHVKVRDDGRGFDPSSRSSGFGLPGMRERVQLLGGELEITSAPGRGTMIQARFPKLRRSDMLADGEPAEARA